MVRDAAAGAGADGFIRTLPDGYATVVGDGARSLSPGERRRIGLARAFLRDAALVILDEPTADLDPHSVAVVAGAVRRLQTGRTVLVIAHRPELIQSADRVVRLVDGVAVRRGRDGGRMSETLPALLTLVACRGAALVAAAVLGALTVVFGVGLMATSGYLISRAAEQPPILSLMVAVAAIQAFGIGRPIVRYLERLSSHDVALRSLGRLRTRFYERIAPLAPAELESYRTGDLLARMVGDVDRQQNLYLRCLLPPVVALLAAAVAVGAAAAFLPAAGFVLLAGLLAGAPRRAGAVGSSRRPCGAAPGRSAR